MVDLTVFLQAMLGLAAAAITVFVIPWIKAKLSVEKQAELAEWVGIAVEAAEMIYKGSGRGEEKKAYVVAFLKEKGYTVDTESLTDAVNALIEAAVRQLKD